MNKTQFILNIIFYPFLLICNFLIYGMQGCIDFVKEVHKYSKKFLKNA